MNLQVNYYIYLWFDVSVDEINYGTYINTFSRFIMLDVQVVKAEVDVSVSDSVL